MSVQPDFLEFVRLLKRRDAQFVLVDAFAVAYHGRPRATGDLDVWIRPTPDNAARVVSALGDFGFGSLGITTDDLLSGKIVQLGREPVRIDLLTDLSGVAPDEVWDGRQEGPFEDQTVFYLNRTVLLKNKRASGRAKDLADIQALEGRD
ncbi:MAG: hypothetical protein HY925_06585 [Elusimicrobia bacterium]|nr:hypothetical protein [Elusimicrobiota bacterium]